MRISRGALRALLASASFGLALPLAGAPPVLAVAAGPPTIDDLAVTPKGSEAVTIEAQVDPNGLKTRWEIWIECEAPSVSEHCAAPVSGHQFRSGELEAAFSDKAVSDTVSLRPGHVYQFAVQVANSDGGTGVGGAIEYCGPPSSCGPAPPPTRCAEGCPGGGGPPYVPPPLSRESEEAGLRWGEGAPAREAERQAKKRREEEEGAERAAARQRAQEASEREGREEVEREAAPQTSRVRCVVPHLEGDSLARARRALKKAHCSLGTVHGARRGHGRVVRGQGIAAGRKLAGGTAVAVTLAPVNSRKHS
jgi:hypothetical protein